MSSQRREISCGAFGKEKRPKGQWPGGYSTHASSPLPYARNRYGSQQPNAVPPVSAAERNDSESIELSGQHEILIIVIAPQWEGAVSNSL
jgi:hypothetical protein